MSVTSDLKTQVDAALVRSPLVLELGCGPSKRDARAVGIDVLEFSAVDIVADALTALSCFPAESVDEIYSEHFLEHVEDPRAVLRESLRVLRPGGVFRATVPHFSNPYFYSDPTHRTFFGLYTVGYWIEKTPFRRGVPQYETPLAFELMQARYTFQSARPFYFRHAVKKALSSWVNLSIWTREFYEENLCQLMPAYEITYDLRRL